MGDLIDRQCLVRLILAESGLFRNVPHGCRRHVVLNKADRADRRKQAEMTVHELMELQAPVDGFIIAAMGKGYVYASLGMKYREQPNLPLDTPVLPVLF
jgi:probable selenium-dependent hydroxylase accessory protein YqeC